MHKLSGLLRVTNILVFIVLTGGCATTNQNQPLPKLSPGKVAIIPARFVPESNLNIYAQGKSAAAGKLGTHGVAEGAAAGAIAPLSDPYGVALYPLIAPFTILAGALIGGTIGASQGLMHGLSAEDAQAVSTIIDNALGRMYVQAQVATRVTEQAQIIGYNVTYLTDVGPTTIEELPAYQDLALEDYNAILELSVTSIKFAAHKGDPPRLALEMKLRSRVVALSGSSVSGTRYIEYKSRPRIVEKWTANHGQLMETEFNTGYSTLSQYVCEIYFPSASMQ
jgi:hypothetical protein